MERYRRQGRDAPHKILLPLSYGVSSTVLLRVLDTLLARQLSIARNRTAYELCVLVIEPSTISLSAQSCTENFELVRKAFPRHSFTKVPFHSIFEYDPEIREVITQFAGPGFADDASLPDKERLDRFRASISATTSKVDVDEILKTRLVAACAKKFDCRAVVWGDSDSRLAAKTLANVAKGRGRSLTWQVSDGMSPWSVEFHFPLRDLFKSELQDYAKLIPELRDIIIPDGPVSENVLTRNLSIDELMLRYVETQGEKYPGVMANVTRMVTKLVPAPESRETHCVFCGAFTGPLGKESSGPLDADALRDEHSPQLCYGCIRSRSEPAN